MSEVDVATVAKFVGALIGAIGGPAVLVRVARAIFPDQKESLRAEIERDAELLAKLPEGSKARAVLLGTIESSLERLTQELSQARRDPFSVVLGVLFICLGLFGAFWGWALEGWWQVPVWAVVTMLLLLGLFGFQQGARQEVRDEKGNPIK